MEETENESKVSSRQLLSRTKTQHAHCGSVEDTCEPTSHVSGRQHPWRLCLAPSPLRTRNRWSGIKIWDFIVANDEEIVYCCARQVQCTYSVYESDPVVACRPQSDFILCLYLYL